MRLVGRAYTRQLGKKVESVTRAFRIGVIGAGTIAEQNHIPGYQKQPDAEVIAVCDIVEELARDVADRCGIPAVYTRWEELLAQSDVDAVSIATPNALHAPIAIAALRAGKHVLCEKPPTLNAVQAAEVSRVVRETGRTYMTCNNLRFSPGVLLLREMVAAGELGEVYYAKTGMIRRRGSPGGWFTHKAASGGGTLLDIGVHVLDLTRWIMGNPRPVAVLGMASQKIGSFQLAEFQTWVPAEMRGVTQRAPDWAGDVDEMAAGLIRFENGASLFLEVSWTLNTAKEGQFTELFGTKAGATLDPFTITSQEHGYVTDKTVKVPTITHQETHARAIRHFLDCIAGGMEPLASADQAVVTMQILDAIYTSSETGRAVDLSSGA